MKTIYLAGSFPTRAHLREIRNELKKKGDWYTTSRWIDWPDTQIDGKSNCSPDDKDANIAMEQNLTDIRASEFIAIFTDPPSSTGGFHVEFGYAIAQPRPPVVIIVGPLPNVFYVAPGIIQFKSEEEFLEGIRLFS